MPVSDAQTSATYDLLLDLAERFEKSMDEENGLEIKVDSDALWNLARSYIDDVERYVAYHDTQAPDEARRSAYLCKWLMKFRPIVVMDPLAPPEEEIRTFQLMANEAFALWCVSGVMQFDWNDVTEKIRHLLLYSLRHRYNSEDTYILFFAQLCKI